VTFLPFGSDALALSAVPGVTDYTVSVVAVDSQGREGAYPGVGTGVTLASPDRDPIPASPGHGKKLVPPSRPVIRSPGGSWLGTMGGVIHVDGPCPPDLTCPDRF
jgi:hypothetical protein